MARNVSRTFATMDDDERRRFALERSKEDPEEVTPIEFPEDDPRTLPASEEKPEAAGPEGGRRD
jgi:hypothetical protein